MSDSSVTQTILKSTAQFLELTTDFDNSYGTKTFFKNMSLSDIWEFIIKDVPPDIRYFSDTTTKLIDSIIKHRLNRGFKERKKIWTNDRTADAAALGKLNSLRLMRDDIRNGKGLINPISVFILPNGVAVLHPGETRMMMADIYKDPMPTILTTYVDNDVTLIFDEIEKIDYQFENKVLEFKSGLSNSKLLSSQFDKAMKLFDKDVSPVMIKEVTDYYNNAVAAYHSPYDMDPPVLIEVCDDKILINEDILAINKDDVWKIVL